MCFWPRPLIDRPVHLVGGHVQEAPDVVSASGIKKRLRSDHVRHDELCGALDGAVNVGLSREVDDGIDVRQQVVKECGIEDIALDELEAVAVGDWIEVALVARVGQGIEHDDGGAIEPWEVVFDRFTNEVGADKSGSTGDE